MQTDGASRSFHVAQRGLGIPGIVRVDQHANAHGGRHQLAQQLEALCYQFAGEIVDAGRVAARTGEARDETERDGVLVHGEDNGDRVGGRLGRQCRRCSDGRDHHGDVAVNQIGGQRRQSIIVVLCPAILDGDV